MSKILKIFYLVLTLSAISRISNAQDSLRFVTIPAGAAYPARRGDLVRYDSAAVMRVETYRQIRSFLISFPGYQQDQETAINEATGLLIQCDSIQANLRAEIRARGDLNAELADLNLIQEIAISDLVDELQKKPSLLERLKTWAIVGGAFLIGSRF